MWSYNINKKRRFKTSTLKSDLYDYSDAYIIAKEYIIIGDPNNNAYAKKLAFKNNAPFISCISKINNTLIYNTEDLYIVIPMYNLIEYSKNYSKTSDTLWNYYGDETISCAEGNINYSIKDSKYFDYKISIVGRLEGNNREKEVKIVLSLKHLNNFWRTLDMSLINCEVSLILTWSENCVLTSEATRDADPDADPAVAEVNNLTNAVFKITCNSKTACTSSYLIN